MTTGFQETISHIKSLQPELEAGDERSVEIFVILPLLKRLDWNTEDPKQIYPQFSPSAGRDRVDYSLQINGQNQVFIEVKQWNANLGESHEAQLRDYCNERRTKTDGKEPKLAVLTNGRQWRLYIPPSKDHPELKRFLALDITIDNDELDEVELYLRKFLEYDKIKVMKRTPNAAHALWRKHIEDEAVLERLREAWKKLIHSRKAQEKVLSSLAQHYDIQIQPEHIKTFLDSSDALFNEVSGKTANGMSLLPRPKGFTFCVKGEETGETVTFQTRSWTRYAHALAQLMYRRHPNVFASKVLAIPKSRFIESSDKPSTADEDWRIEDSNIYFRSPWNAESLMSLGFEMLKIFGYSDENIDIHYS